MNMLLGERLKLLRERRKMTQEKLAELTGLKRVNIAKWETSQAKPDYESIRTLANFYDCSIDYLLGHTEIIYRSDDMANISPEWVEVVKESTGAGYTPGQVKDILKKAGEIAESFRSVPLAKNDE